ncbi:MAG: hypothetical protein WCW17_01005 [Patescibacteria group bacterium]
MTLEEKYWRKAEKAAYYLEAAPFLRMVGVNGSLTSGKINQMSDIDFLIVTKSKRIFTCRFFVNFIIQILNLKRTNSKIAGRICLNRYITTDSLVIYPYDIYHAKVYSTTVPILDKNIYQKFIDENYWMNNFVEVKKNTEKKHNKNILLICFCIFFEHLLSGTMGNIIENILKNIQIKKIKNNSLTLKNKGLIIANDAMLCFHPTSLTRLTKIG